jgi:hypothetical protein
MPIQEENIVFVESQVMADVPEGGGAATGKIIVDGQMNNVFEDISDLDRAYGRFNLRKLFLAVRTLSTDLYGGVKTAVTAVPSDDAIGYTLFTTNDPFDTRSEAADRVEAYLYKGPMWPGYLYENHIEGMRAISLIQKVGSVLPPVGKTLCLVQDEDLAGEKEQYVRVIDVSSTIAMFEDEKGEFFRMIVTMQLSDALRYDFNGHSPERFDLEYIYTGKTRVRDTTVADATLYYSTQPLTLAANIGDTSVKAASMFTQLVPASQTESALVDQTMSPELTITVSAGSRTVSFTQQGHSFAKYVTPENRSFNQIQPLVPRPQPGVVSVAYMAQGNWYLLTDDGNGIISGSDPTFGTGTINYETGTASITLGALPDSGSDIVWTWGSSIDFETKLGAINGYHYIDLPDNDVARNTVSVSYTQGGVLKTATDNGSGKLMQSTTQIGDVRYADGQIFIDVLIDSGTTVTVDYQIGDPIIQEFIDPIRDPNGTTVTLGLDTLPIEPGSVKLSWDTLVQEYEPEDLETRVRTLVVGPPPPPRNPPLFGIDPILIAYDDSNGVMKLRNGSVVGTIDYQTGVLTFTCDYVTAFPHLSFGFVTTDISTRSLNITQTAITITEEQRFNGIQMYQTAAFAPPDFDATVQYRSTDSPTAKSITVSPVLQIPLVGDSTNYIVQDSIEFTIAGTTYTDNNGVLIKTGGVESGTINYDNGLAELTIWGSGSITGNVTSCLTIKGNWAASVASFRTAISPVKPESVTISAVTLDGVQLLGVAGPAGLITGDSMTGVIDYNFGIAKVMFGSFVNGAWEPIEVDPSSITYNAVSYKYLPLDADILGIDAVRLPADGRVPIFRPGGIVLVMHTDQSAPATIGNGGTIAAGRTRLAWVKVVDANGDKVSSTLYTLDRDAGTVTFPDVTGLIQPLTLHHTVADLRMITDAQISGELTLSRPLSHDFPANESLVASCLIQGDRRARVSLTFDQSTWDSTWQDYQVGSAATATLNTIDYPILVTNEGCDTDRWAIKFTSSATAQLISEKRGLVWEGNFSNTEPDIAPVNPRSRGADGSTHKIEFINEANGSFSVGETVTFSGTATGVLTTVDDQGTSGWLWFEHKSGPVPQVSETVTNGTATATTATNAERTGAPYMTIQAASNGGGWATGNVVRFNTIGAIADLWIARSIQQSDVPTGDGADGCEIYALGNIDRP